ncbi:PiggyBac transposable element-derived protein 3 [Eumeta japonica]|uniref:PiggyBac transposable element-derived protein 3 n=1 Tax=Eumeta variegata TaxID=151549 RepID=A0A4C1XTW2_EUMVA|nr:PiggyBac transposable element-derived protein 3 [Eumeta japonica]
MENIKQTGSVVQIEENEQSQSIEDSVGDTSYESGSETFYDNDETYLPDNSSDDSVESVKVESERTSSSENINILIGNITKLSVNEIISQLEDDDDVLAADIYKTPPLDGDKSDEDSGDEDSGKINWELKKLGHDGTGTIRANRVDGAPLKDQKEMKKTSRRSYHQCTDILSDITLVRYNDNNIVSVASTQSGVIPIGKAKRYCDKQKIIALMRRS